MINWKSVEDSKRWLDNVSKNATHEDWVSIVIGIFHLIKESQEAEKRKLVRHYMKRMREIQENEDWQIAHREADMELVDLLNKLGYSGVTRGWEEIGKWYA